MASRADCIDGDDPTEVEMRKSRTDGSRDVGADGFMCSLVFPIPELENRFDQDRDEAHDQVPEGSTDPRNDTANDTKKH